MKTRPVEPSFPVRKDTHDEANSRCTQFCERVYKNGKTNKRNVKILRNPYYVVFHNSRLLVEGWARHVARFELRRK
jgi:hypothetical protein